MTFCRRESIRRPAESFAGPQTSSLAAHRHPDTENEDAMTFYAILYQIKP